MNKQKKLKQQKYEVVDAEVYLSVDVTCPYCTNCMDIRQQLSDMTAWFNNSLSIQNLNVEIKCINCENIFLVENVNY